MSDDRPIEISDFEKERRRDWIRSAQERVTYHIGGRDYGRVRFGEETAVRSADMVTCPDCGVRLGQYHVPGCGEERCPVCGLDVVSCDCAYGAAG
jgi:hypothetical protein